MALENKLFEQYRLRQLIAPNNWLGETLATQQPVVVRLIPGHPDPAQISPLNESFERQMQNLRQLNHPRILPVLDYGRTPGFFYLAWPLLAGGNLEQRLLSANLPQPQVLALFRQLLEALAVAHRAKIWHGALNPGCLWFDEKGQLGVAGFGLAKIEKENQAPLSAPPQYLAPEQFLGYGDYRSDFYSAGIILYRLLTGRLPYNAPDPAQIVEQHLHAPLPLPDPQIPLPLELVLTRALQKRPEERFDSAEEMLEAFNKALVPNSSAPATPKTDAPLPLPQPEKVEAVTPVPAAAPKVEAEPKPAPSPARPVPTPPPTGSFSLENAVTAPYSFSNMVDEGNAPGIDGLAVFQPILNSAASPSAVQPRGWPLPMLLTILFLLALAIGLAVLVVFLSL